MALTIESAEAERLARELAEHTGESVDDAVLSALRQQLTRAPVPWTPGPTGEEAIRIMKDIGERMSRLPILDDRSADEILGYDENGLPT